MKAKLGMYNVVYGILGQIITMAVGLIIPRLFIVNLGSEANGLISSINQIFIYIGLLEAGIGTVSIQALYKPISKNNKDEINSVLSATSNYYKVIAKYYFFSVIILGIIYPIIIESDYSNFEIFLVILFLGLSGVINFLFQGKYKIFLMAEGKNYIITNISTIVGIIVNLAKVLLLTLGFDIVIIQLSYLLINIVQMILFEIYIKKNYNWINTKSKPNYSSISQKNSAFIHQISALIFSNTDILLITVFCGLRSASVYSLYNLIIGYVSMLLGHLNSGIIFILGQTYHEDMQKYIKLNDAYNTYYTSITFAIYTVTYILMLPFLNLYTKGITDINYIDPMLLSLFIFVQLLSIGRTAGNNAINIAGHFNNTKNKAIIESSINIIISLICVNLLGIYGVLIGTIVALVYRMNDIILYSSKYILNTSPIKVYKIWLSNLILMIIVLKLAYLHDFKINTYSDIFVYGAGLCLLIIPIFIIFGSIVNFESYKYIKYIFKRKLKTNM